MEIQDEDVKKAEALKTSGNELFKKGNFNEALKLYQEASQINSQEVTYNLNLAACYHELKDYDKAIEQCQIVINNTFNFQKKAKALGRLGFAYQEKGDFAKAIEAFENSLVEHKDQRIKEALRTAERLKKEKEELEYLDNDKAEEANNRGNEKYKKHDFVEALKDYTEAVKRNPKSPKYFSNRAACYIKLLSFTEALYDCEKALELDPTFLRAHQRFCNVQVMMKRYHKAMTSYEHAIKLYPDDKELKEGYAKCMAKISEGGDDKERLNQTMQDPEIQGLMVDPRVQQFLKDLKENPKSANEAIMKDEFLREAFRKLVASGIIKTK